MTYSHNSVSNNLKMTTATAATAAAVSTLRTKNMSHGGGGSRSSPPSTPLLSAHSNSIASSTNYQQQQQLILSSSPPISSGASTTSNCSSSSSVSSLGSAGNGGGYFGSARKQQRNRQQQRRSPQQQQQQPQHQQVHHPQVGSASKRYGGSGQKQRDGQRSPQVQAARQSPASVLGGGLSILYSTPTGLGHNSARKSRSKHTSPLLCANGSSTGGKISPTIPLIPTALTHFAGSKCFDAPAPTALPKPPEHWTLNKSEEKLTSSAGPSLQSVINARYNHQRHHHHHHHYNHNHNNSGSSSSSYSVDAHTYGGHVVKSSKRNLLDDFDTHNLKLLLNVQS